MAGNAGIDMPELCVQGQFGAQQAAWFADEVGQQLVEALPQGLAGFAVAAQGVLAQLFGQRADAQAGHLPGFADGEQFVEQVVGTVGLPLQGRQARRADIALDDRLGGGQARQQVQAIGEYGAGLGLGVAFEQHVGQGRGHQQGDAAASADILVGLAQAGAQRPLGAEHLALPEIRQAELPVAMAAYGIHAGGPFEARRILAVMAGTLGMPRRQG
ncbi:hypothetical protein D3C86_1428910 [compost metagenome]